MTKKKLFYCKFYFTSEKKNGAVSIDFSGCGYQIKNSYSLRAAKLEWEHITPASWFGDHRFSWKNHHIICPITPKSGKDCARKNDPAFKMMERDLHNLVPEIGELIITAKISLMKK